MFCRVNFFSKVSYRNLTLKTVSSCRGVVQPHQKCFNSMINNTKRLPVGNNSFIELHIIKRDFKVSSTIFDKETIVSAPEFPESVAEGDLKWQKEVGEAVKTDEVVCEIETDKVSIPVSSPGNGVLVEIFAKDGDIVKSKQQLFKVKLGDSQAAVVTEKKKPPAPVSKISASEKKQVEVTPSPKPVVSSAPQKRPTEKQPFPGKIPPAAAAPQLNISPESMAIKLPPPDPTKEISGTRTEHRVKMNRLRQRVAQRLKEAQNVFAMLTTFNEIDMTNIIKFRKDNLETFTKKHGLKLGFMSAFLKASAYALQEFPVVNAVIAEKEIIYRDYIDISVAVATPKGLVVPVIRNVERMNYVDIEKAILHYGQLAKTGQLAIEDMDGGTFTVSNGGVFGSLMGTPILNPPQSAILGMHATIERPVAINHQVVIRPMMYVALTYDHRLVDGREAVLFLRKIKAAVENPVIIFAGL